MFERIFVRIASYRDPECSSTIQDLFEKASVPERLRVGVCLQYAPGRDSPNLELGAWASRVEVTRVRAAKSRGVCWARAQVESLWRGEEYSLQVDSHSRFAPGFDERLIEELRACPSAKPALSSSPGSYEEDRLELDPPPSLRVIAGFDERGSLRLRGIRPGERWTVPRASPWVAGGFFFSRAEVLTEVPYDPELYFDQEEAAYALRLFCAGWDVFAPRETFVFHRYRNERSELPLHWRDNPDWELLRAKGQARFDALVGHRSGVSLGRFGLAGARPLAAFETLAGVDFIARRARDSRGELHQEELRAPEDGARETPSTSRVELGVGDAVPFVRLKDEQGRAQSIQKLGGRWTCLLFAPSGGLDAARKVAEGALLPSRSGGSDLVVVLREDGDEVRLPGIPTWREEGASLTASFSSEGLWSLVVLSPALRVEHLARGSSPSNLLREVGRVVAAAPRPSSAIVSRPHAPVLHVRRALDSEDRARLVEMFELGASFPGRVGARGGRLDPRQKVREDLILSPAGCAFVDRRLGARVFPEIEKAFGLTVLYREPYKLAAYEASQKGFFGAHRDNLDPELAYRRFAITINLNDEFMGGEIAFPEYERSAFRVAAGDAIVFSCALLHEARPVIRGTRRILLGFVAGASARDSLCRAGKEERFRVDVPTVRLGVSAD